VAIAIKGALDRINLDLVDEVYMGNVVQAGTGQALHVKLLFLQVYPTPLVQQ
jgi:acetyl-CoA acetyltransferase